jgi:hypothetical protein
MSWRAQNDEPFELVSVHKSEPPDGNNGKDWVRYEISQGANLITGYRQGSLTSIKRAAEQIVVGLNERRSPKRGRVQLTQLKKAARSKAS